MNLRKKVILNSVEFIVWIKQTCFTMNDIVYFFFLLGFVINSKEEKY